RVLAEDVERLLPEEPGIAGGGAVVAGEGREEPALGPPDVELRRRVAPEPADVVAPVRQAAQGGGEAAAERAGQVREGALGVARPVAGVALHPRRGAAGPHDRPPGAGPDRLERLPLVEERVGVVPLDPGEAV